MQPLTRKAGSRAIHTPAISAGSLTPEIGRVLVPRLVGADARRLDQRHLLEEHAAATEQLIENAMQPAVHRRRLERRRILDEMHVFADRELALVGTERRRHDA